MNQNGRNKTLVNAYKRSKRTASIFFFQAWIVILQKTIPSRLRKNLLAIVPLHFIKSETNVISMDISNSTGFVQWNFVTPSVNPSH